MQPLTQKGNKHIHEFLRIQRLLRKPLPHFEQILLETQLKNLNYHFHYMEGGVDN